MGKKAWQRRRDAEIRERLRKKAGLVGKPHKAGNIVNPNKIVRGPANTVDKQARRMRRRKVRASVLPTRDKLGQTAVRHVRAKRDANTRVIGQVTVEVEATQLQPSPSFKSHGRKGGRHTGIASAAVPETPKPTGDRRHWSHLPE